MFPVLYSMWYSFILLCATLCASSWYFSFLPNSKDMQADWCHWVCVVVIVSCSRLEPCPMGYCSLVIKVLDWLEDCEFESHVHQVATTGPLNKALHPQLLGCIIENRSEFQMPRFRKWLDICGSRFWSVLCAYLLNLIQYCPWYSIYYVVGYSPDILHRPSTLALSCDLWQPINLNKSGRACLVGIGSTKLRFEMIAKAGAINFNLLIKAWNHQMKKNAGQTAKPWCWWDLLRALTSSWSDEAGLSILKGFQSMPGVKCTDFCRISVNMLALCRRSHDA